jgi:hypothetical protein
MCFDLGTRLCSEVGHWACRFVSVGWVKVENCVEVCYKVLFVLTNTQTGYDPHPAWPLLP